MERAGAKSTPNRKLKGREQRFVDAYTGEAKGNATKACILAGYSEKAARQIGSRLLTKANICDAIANIRTESAAIATKDELHTFWSATMRNADVPWKDRLKASELHAKANGLFIERHEHELTVTVDVSRARERLAGNLVGLSTRVTRSIPERTDG